VHPGGWPPTVRHAVGIAWFPHVRLGVYAVETLCRSGEVGLLARLAAGSRAACPLFELGVDGADVREDGSSHR